MQYNLLTRIYHSDVLWSTGIDGDLERSKKQLIRKGLLSKENFDSNDVDDEFYKGKFHQYQEDHPLLADKAEQEKKLQQENAEAFENWLAVKELRETAIKYLSFIKLSNAELGMDDKPGSVQGSARSSLNRQSIASAKSESGSEHNIIKFQYCFKIGVYHIMDF